MAFNIYIDQGHNPYGFNAGAEGFGVREQDITWQIGQYLYNILSEDDRFLARLSRPSPDTILGYNNTSSLRERVTRANEWPADYFISIHANASTNPEANGSEVYVAASYTRAWYLAMDVLSEIVRRTETKYNGVLLNPGLYVLRNTTMPAILVELGYITNYEDNQKMLNNGYQFAYGIYVGLLNYLGLPQLTAAQEDQ
ncbi:MAG: N-acetylmuramoyl-L-alanine amidase [Eubacterium sp.]|nr:N-acetylmuramoyl-L-alanine amidase [Eubacterium sp.]